MTGRLVNARPIGRSVASYFVRESLNARQASRWERFSCASAQRPSSVSCKRKPGHGRTREAAGVEQIFVAARGEEDCY
jgi:hypothetical protein